MERAGESATEYLKLALAVHGIEKAVIQCELHLIPRFSSCGNTHCLGYNASSRNDKNRMERNICILC